AAVSAGQSADRMAQPRIVDRVRHRLYDVFEACDAAEHRDRRIVRRGTTALRLDGGYRHDRTRRTPARADHLCVDAAALLGARARPQGGISAREHSAAAASA